MTTKQITNINGYVTAFLTKNAKAAVDAWEKGREPGGIKEGDEENVRDKKQCEKGQYSNGEIREGGSG